MRRDTSQQVRRCLLWCSSFSPQQRSRRTSACCRGGCLRASSYRPHVPACGQGGIERAPVEVSSNVDWVAKMTQRLEIFESVLEPSSVDSHGAVDGQERSGSTAYPDHAVAEVLVADDGDLAQGATPKDGAASLAYRAPFLRWWWV
eukprot:165476-Pyramimonas_sp.AAC.1